MVNAQAVDLYVYASAALGVNSRFCRDEARQGANEAS
jgi:hypothetical protein